MTPHALVRWKDRLARSPLARWLPAALRPARPAPAPGSGIGLDGLPPELARLPVGAPVALAWADPQAGQPWAQALLQDLLQDGPVFLLAEHEGLADPLLQHPALAEAVAQGRLRVWLLAMQRRGGLARRWDELARAGLTPAHALVVLASPAAQLGASVAQMQRSGRQIARWCRARTRPVVLAFCPWASAQQVLGPLRGLASSFQHVALLGFEARNPVLYVERWNTGTAAIFEARLGLRMPPDGARLVADGSRALGPAQRLVEAPDQYAVIATAAAVAGQRGVPPEWQVLPPGADVLQATEHAIAATVLIDSGPATAQEELLQRVYALRCRHGSPLKIVVRETPDKLRANLERALLHLGANAVVYRELGFARLIHQLAGMAHEGFARDIPADFASARAGFMPDARRGYVPLASFCDSVEAMLERTAPMGLGHCFLRLTMQPHVAHLDAIQACTALRDGDLVSADANALYVFLFACAETDVEPALARLFSIAPLELFAGQTLLSTREDLREVLLGLRDAAHQGAPDFSAYRRVPAPPAPAARAAETAQGATDQPTPDPAAPAAPQEALGSAPPVLTVQARPLARRAPSPGGAHAG